MGPTAGTTDRFDRLEGRLESVIVLAVPYFSLAISLGLYLTWGGDGGLHRTVTLGLVALTVGWVAWMVNLHPGWADRRRLMGLYYAVLIVLLATLVARSPWFGFATFTGYVHAFRLLRAPWQYAGVAATAVIAATSQVGAVPPTTVAALTTYGVAILFNVVVAGLFSVLGWVSTESSRRRKEAFAELSEAHAQLAAAMEENAGLHAQLLVQAREAGVQDERERMAREIHDTLAQGLTGIITQLEAAEQAAERSERWRRHVDIAARLARESLTEARRSMRAMRPVPLDGAQLGDALADVTRRWSADSGVPAEVTTTGTALALRPEVEATLLRTAQEALANVAKHANASKVGVTLSYMEDEVALDVRDDGVGFTPGGRVAAGSAGGGFGLTGMRQRVALVDGHLEIESEPGAGTAVSARLPIPSGPVGGDDG